MRSDYSLYGLAVIFFILAGICFILLTGDQRTLTAVSTIVLGFLSIGLGYSQRPKATPQTSTATQPAEQPNTQSIESQTVQTTTTEPVAPSETKKEEAPSISIPKGEAEIIVAPVTAIQEKPKTEMQPLMEIPTTSAIPVIPDKSSLPAAPSVELTEIKGIKEKRAAQLKSLGITNAEDLAKAPAKDIAEKLKISPKIVEKWIIEAKRITEK